MKVSFGAQGRNAPLYTRLGGLFVIAALVDRFSDAVLADPVVGIYSPNPALAQWATQEKKRLPGLKFQRTAWLASASGGPQTFVSTHGLPRGVLHLGRAHHNLHISSEEFDVVAGILKRTMNEFNVGALEQQEVMNAFMAHKNEVVNE